jgi:pyruvate,water dikinase
MSDRRDPLHGSSYPDSMWTMTNAGEAIPGVATPLTYTFWAEATERGVRGTFFSMGALRRRRETEMPAEPRERLLGAFYGRPALRVDFLALMGDRMPGGNGAGIAKDIFASAFPPGFVSRPRRAYYPLVAVKLPCTMITGPGRMRRGRALTQRVWQDRVPKMAVATTAEARACFVDAREQFERNVYLASMGLFVVVQPVYEALDKLVDRAGGGIDKAALMAGYGAHEESRLLADLWECSRGRLELPVFLARHGYHGPNEGQMSSLAWREDPSPLERIMAGYRAKNDDADPTTADAARIEAREQAERSALAALSGPRRLAARAVLALARRRLPLRAVAKVAFLQSLDTARAAARRLGATLTEEGHLDQPDDVFFLTATEIIEGDWAGKREEITYRRGRYQEYLGYDVPNSWVGMTEPLVAVADDARDRATATVLNGVAASHGVVEGRARVVLEPGDDDLEPDEILVAHYTDPSWASILFLASALVIDIGGRLSHAAVVSRELGVPCVADTRNGTRVIRTGDRIRVDGTAGTVTVLERAMEATA